VLLAIARASARERVASRGCYRAVVAVAGEARDDARERAIATQAYNVMVAGVTRAATLYAQARNGRRREPVEVARY